MRAEQGQTESAEVDASGLGIWRLMGSSRRCCREEAGRGEPPGSQSAQDWPRCRLSFWQEFKVQQEGHVGPATRSHPLSNPSITRHPREVALASRPVAQSDTDACPQETVPRSHQGLDPASHARPRTEEPEPQRGPGFTRDLPPGPARTQSHPTAHLVTTS